MKKIIFGILIVVFGCSLIAEKKVETTEFSGRDIEVKFNKTFESFAKYLDTTPTIVKTLASSIKLEAETKKRVFITIVKTLGITLILLALIALIVSEIWFEWCYNNEKLVIIFWGIFAIIVFMFFVFFIVGSTELGELNSRIKFPEAYAIKELWLRGS